MDNSYGRAHTAEIIITIIFCGIGLVGNVLSIVVILVLNEHKKSQLHKYLLQLSFADLLFILAIPLRINEDLLGEWGSSNGVCKANNTLMYTNYYASLLFLMVLSLDRYIAVCHSRSVWLMELRKPRASWTIVVIVWIISVLASAPFMIYSSVAGVAPNCKCRLNFPDDCKALAFEALVSGSSDGKDLNSLIKTCEANQLSSTTCAKPESVTNHSAEDDDKKECSIESRGFKTFTYVIFSAGFVLPLLVMALSYGLIIRHLKKNIPRRHDSVFKMFRKSSVKKLTQSEQMKRRVTSTSILMVLFFAFTWMPYFGILIAKTLGITKPHGTKSFCHSLSALSYIFSFVNSVFNPYLYNYTGLNRTKRWKKFLEKVPKFPCASIFFKDQTQRECTQIVYSTTAKTPRPVQGGNQRQHTTLTAAAAAAAAYK